MTETCRICGQAIETTDTTEDPSRRQHAGCREPEPASLRDLRSLIELTDSRAQTTARAEVVLDAPPSVREAIRVVDELLPVARTSVPRRLRLAALPVIVLAIAGVVLAVTQGSRRREDARPPRAVMTEVRSPSSVEVTASPSPSGEAASPPSDPPPSVQAVVRPSRPHSPSAAPRQRVAASAAPSAQAPAPAPPPEPPSLMQAITDAVHPGASHPPEQR